MTATISYYNVTCTAAIHYSCVQALVNLVELNSGRPRQQIQTAEVIEKKLCQLGVHKNKEKFWPGLVEKLPHGAQVKCKRLRRLVLKKGLPTEALVQAEATLCKHIVLKEIVAWYTQDEKRMKNYHSFNEARFLPPLPACLTTVGRK